MRENLSYLHKMIVILISSVLFLSLVYLSVPVNAVEISKKTKEINIVYDDSGSMYNGTFWSEAKYAAEVIAAMMGENVIVNIYPMSSYSQPIRLDGSKNTSKNVMEVANFEGGAGSTPFAAVRAAADAIMKSAADDRWLIVLTDGGFNDEEYEQWSDSLISFAGQNNTRVIFTTIGFENPLINVNKEGFMAYQAYDEYTGESRILETMTSMAARVFNYQSVDLKSVGGGTVSFDADVPLSKMIVFAQGDSVQVGDVSVNGTALSDYSETSVQVKVDETTAVPRGYPKGSFPVAPSLDGIVYTLNAKDENKPFSDGTYSFSCNTDNVQVFVEPGVMVEAVLSTPDGETVRLSGDVEGKLTEGEWKVGVELINPLTGQIIDPANTSILSGASMDIVVIEDGETHEYSDGENIVIDGNALEMYGRTQYKGITGIIEKTSQVYSFKVEKSPLRFSFSSPGGYELDAVILSLEEDIEFTVTVGSTQLTKEQAAKLKLEVDDVQGIEWDIEPVNETGTFRLVPKYASRKGLKSVTAGSGVIEIEGSLKDQKETRTGTGTANINILTVSKLGLVLSLEMPQEQTFDNAAEKYMFDSRIRGIPGPNDPERPYILVRVQVKDKNGDIRDLTNDEWEAGLDGFSFKATSIKPKLGWKIIKVLTIGGQSLAFEPEQGAEVSTYKLYLAGLTDLNVLPNTSDLEVSLDIPLENGTAMSGTQNGTITVRPMAWWRYILYFLILLAVLVVGGIILARELTKPRIPRDFSPEIYVTVTMASVPQQPVQPQHHARFKRKHRFSLFKPEECSVRFDSQDTGITINFKVVATGKDEFRIVDGPNTFNQVRNTVLFNRMDYQKFSQSPDTAFNTGDRISYTKTIGMVVKNVRLVF